MTESRLQVTRQSLIPRLVLPFSVPFQISGLFLELDTPWSDTVYLPTITTSKSDHFSQTLSLVVTHNPNPPSATIIYEGWHCF